MFLFKSGYCQQYCKIMLASNQEAAPAPIPAVEPNNLLRDCLITLLFSITGKKLANIIYPQMHTLVHGLRLSHVWAICLAPMSLRHQFILLRMIRRILFHDSCRKYFSCTFWEERVVNLCPALLSSFYIKCHQLNALIFSI